MGKNILIVALSLFTLMFAAAYYQDETMLDKLSAACQKLSAAVETQNAPMTPNVTIKRTSSI